MPHFQCGRRGFESRTEHHADVVQRQNTTLPRWIRGFDSRRRLQRLTIPFFGRYIPHMDTDSVRGVPIFRSRYQADLLAHLLLGEDEYPMSVLSRDLGIPLTTLHREVDRLEESGIIESRRVGRSRLLRTNAGHPAVRPLRELLVTMFGPPNAGVDTRRPTEVPSRDSARLRRLIHSKQAEMRKALQDADVTDAYIFGSVARGTAGPESDIDIFVEYAPHVSDVDAYLSTGALIDTLGEILQTNVDVLSEVSAKPQVLDSARKDLIPLEQVS